VKALALFCLAADGYFCWYSTRGLQLLPAAPAPAYARRAAHWPRAYGNLSPMPKLYLLLAALGLSAGLTGCFSHFDDANELPVYRPVLMARTSLEQAVALVPAREMHNTGKIYRQGNYVLINERYEGLHIIDNHDPAQPQNVGFLRIPGSLDIAMRGTTLYADNAVDLVTVDLSNPTSVRVLGRVRDAFPELAPPEASSIEESYRPENRPPDAIVVGWQKVK
jgi:LVIVD repeat